MFELKSVLAGVVLLGVAGAAGSAIGMPVEGFCRVDWPLRDL
jgi:hypothetical protein